MERTEILKKLQSIFADVLDNDKLSLTESASADNVDGWDSLSHVQLISEIEDEFDLSFTTVEIMQWKTIGDMISSIQKYV